MRLPPPSTTKHLIPNSSNTGHQMRSTLEGRTKAIGHESTLTNLSLDQIGYPLEKILEQLQLLDEGRTFFAGDFNVTLIEPHRSMHTLVVISESEDVSSQPDIDIRIEPAEITPVRRVYRTDPAVHITSQIDCASAFFSLEPYLMSIGPCYMSASVLADHQPYLAVLRKFRYQAETPHFRFLQHYQGVH
ncbi:hypothetical protein E4U57_000214 [Claviceps arundinis]|uniref:Uncharacterized protein n=1 Tax=Claviceps arundinis TaxID=1623583 RepID=A0ABQ7PDA7_9HYPO|nr:hypothetical protein E4U57_000214 [Claviceps arundinis]